MRQQPWTLAASLNPRIADSDRCSWEERRIGGEQPHLVGLRLSRLASCRPGWLPLGQGRDRLVEIPTATPWSKRRRSRVSRLGVGGGLAVDAGGVDLVDRPAQGVGDLAGPGLGVGVDGVGVVEVADHVSQALLDTGQVVVIADGIGAPLGPQPARVHRAHDGRLHLSVWAVHWSSPWLAGGEAGLRGPSEANRTIRSSPTRRSAWRSFPFLPFPFLFPSLPRARWPDRFP